MKNDVFDITWVADLNGDKVKIYFREENNKPVAYLESAGSTDKFNNGRMAFVDGIASYLLFFQFFNDEYGISGTIVDSLTIVPSSANYPGNIALSDDARLMLKGQGGKNLEFKKYIKKLVKLSEIARVQVGKKLTPIPGGIAMYVRDYSNNREIRVNECMVDNEHAVFFGISLDNIDFFTDCDDNSGRYCAAENIAVLTNIEHRFDKPWMQDELEGQVRRILQETGQQVLTLEQVKNLVLDDDRFKNKVINFGDLNLIM